MLAELRNILSDALSMLVGPARAVASASGHILRSEPADVGHGSDCNCHECTFERQDQRAY